jgi:uncharacterized membrane protein
MMSVAEFLVILFCGLGLFLILAVGAWVLVNKSKLESPGSRQQEKLDELDREYAAGDLDESEYDRRRAQILNDRMQ